MWAAILAFLKAAAEKAGEAAIGGAKLLGKGALEGGKLAAKGGQELLKKTEAGKLFNAFASMGGKRGNTPAELKGTAFDINKYGGGNTGEVSGMGNVPVTPSIPTQIPSQYQQFTRQPDMQFVPGPQGTVIGGQGGTVMPGYDMQSPQSRIPPAYLQMARAGQPPQLPQQTGQSDVGAIRGFINALTGQPQPEGIGNVSQGRRTAYYAGGVIPNIVMSKLGQPSSAEATSREYLNQYYQEGSPMYDPITGKPTGVKVPARGTAVKKESPSEQKYSKELDFNASLKDWAGDVVDDETAYKMMSENFPEMQKQIDDYYFRKTGIYPIGKGRR